MGAQTASDIMAIGFVVSLIVTIIIVVIIARD